MDFTGLDEDMYQQTVQKIRFQLESQGFTNIADFSKDGGKPFFMKDTIHLGWMGWLAFDKAVDPFLSNPTPALTYHLNERFSVKTGRLMMEMSRNFNKLLKNLNFWLFVNCSGLKKS